MPVVPAEEDTVSLSALVTVGAAVVTIIKTSLALREADEAVVTVVEGEVVCGVTRVGEGTPSVTTGVVTAGGAGLRVDVTWGVLVVPLV